MANKLLQVIQQKDVDFYGDTVIAVKVADDSIVVPLRPIIEGLGLNWSSQRKRLNRDLVLSKHLKVVVVTTTTSQYSVLGTREMVCLPLKYIPGFLFGVNPARVREELREKIIRYQEECHDVLAEAFTSGRLTGTDVTDIANADPDAVEALRVAEAVVRLARSHVRLSAQVNQNKLQLDQNIQRLEAIEAQLGDPTREITAAQASQIQDTVKAIAIHFSNRSGRNEYGSVWGEFHRRFEVNSYLRLPASRFEEAIEFLSDWLNSLTSDAEF